MSLLSALFGSYSKRELKRVQPICDAVLALDEKYRSFSDERLAGMTGEFRERLKMGASLDDILPEAFAVCREATARVLNTRHFPVQVIGAIVLHQGRIAEMKTGEGKTQTVMEACNPEPAFVELPIPAALPTAMPSADSCDMKPAAVLRNSRGLVLEIYNHTSADIIRSILEVLVHAE